MEYFYSVSEDRLVETKVKRSTFIAHLHYVETMQEAKEFISKISAEHKTANHNCWAYIIGEKGDTFHSSDAGEPSGTAGQPMLNALKKHDMTNIVAVVTRYFGGVKLGIRGLIEAYGLSVENAIESASLKKLVKYQEFKIYTTYDFADTLKHRISHLKAEIMNAEYAAEVSLEIQIEECLSEEMNNYLSELKKAGKIRIESE
ncbi:MAG: YigZ family protein [Candidatus Cloacimonadales bacterium]|nr:YigZ family protein [Candidatus Cloacimonadales bacterium]